MNETDVNKTGAHEAAGGTTVLRARGLHKHYGSARASPRRR
jgi:hypothetical protein